MSDRAPHEGRIVRGLNAAFGNNVVLDDVSLSVEPGETVALFGPSGASVQTVTIAAASVAEEVRRHLAGEPPLTVC